MLAQIQEVLVLNIQGKIREVGTWNEKNTHAEVQVLFDKAPVKQVSMQVSGFWPATPTTTKKRVAKMRRGLTIIACW